MVTVLYVSRHSWNHDAGDVSKALEVSLGDGASARDLTVVSWGGTYQDAQRKIYFEPFSKASVTITLSRPCIGAVGSPSATA